MDAAAFVQSQFAQRRMYLPRCVACGRTHWYPRDFCPFCFDGQIEWTVACGEGHVYSFSVTATQPPLVLAYVTLPEGPSMMTNLVDTEPDRVFISMPVRLAWRAGSDGLVRPFFAPA